MNTEFTQENTFEPISKLQAVETVETLKQSNYLLAPMGDGYFQSASKAYEYIYGGNFTEMDLVIPAFDGEDCLSLTLKHNGQKWAAIDESESVQFEGDSLIELVESLYETAQSLTETSYRGVEKFIPQCEYRTQITNLLTHFQFGYDDISEDVIVDVDDEVYEKRPQKIEFIKKMALNLYHAKGGSLDFELSKSIDKTVQEALALNAPKCEDEKYVSSRERIDIDGLALKMIVVRYEGDVIGYTAHEDVSWGIMEAHQRAMRAIAEKNKAEIKKTCLDESQHF